MPLVLVRHADAEDSSPGGDLGRPLTATGRRQAEDTARWLATAVKPLPTQIRASPATRTTQTAELLVATWKAGAIAPSDALRPGRTASEAEPVARAHESQVLVGHQPTLGELAAVLLGRPALPFAFERGAAMVLEPAADGHFRLLAYRAPFGDVVTRLEPRPG